METMKLKDAPFIALNALMPANQFRTVYMEDLIVPHGRSEIKVQIEFSRESSQLGKYVPDCYKGMMYVYGYIKSNAELEKLFSNGSETADKNRRIDLYDWNDRFLMVLQSGDRATEHAFFVKPEEVKALMDGGLHPNKKSY
jgi:hypothetical protein